TFATGDHEVRGVAMNRISIRLTTCLMCIICSLMVGAASAGADLDKLYRDGLTAYNGQNCKAAITYFTAYRREAKQQHVAYTDPGFLPAIDSAIKYCERTLQRERTTD